MLKVAFKVSAVLGIILFTGIIKHTYSDDTPPDINFNLCSITTYVGTYTNELGGPAVPMVLIVGLSDAAHGPVTGRFAFYLDGSPLSDDMLKILNYGHSANFNNFFLHTTGRVIHRDSSPYWEIGSLSIASTASNDNHH